MSKKQLSPKSQKLLDKIMVDFKKDAPTIANVVMNIKKLSTPEGQKELKDILSKKGL